MPTPDDQQQYLDLDSLAPEERIVFDLAIAALSLPMTRRHAWFLHAGVQLEKTTVWVETRI